MKPLRTGEEAAASIEASEGGANLSLDAAERLLQRPVNEDKQREKYSGKRKSGIRTKTCYWSMRIRKKVVYLSDNDDSK